jgi:hypothetical protein
MHAIFLEAARVARTLRSLTRMIDTSGKQRLNVHHKLSLDKQNHAAQRGMKKFNGRAALRATPRHHPR